MLPSDPPAIHQLRFPSGTPVLRTESDLLGELRLESFNANDTVVTSHQEMTQTATTYKPTLNATTPGGISHKQLEWPIHRTPHMFIHATIAPLVSFIAKIYANASAKRAALRFRSTFWSAL